MFILVLFYLLLWKPQRTITPRSLFGFECKNREKMLFLNFHAYVFFSYVSLPCQYISLTCHESFLPITILILPLRTYCRVMNAGKYKGKLILLHFSNLLWVRKELFELIWTTVFNSTVLQCLCLENICYCIVIVLQMRAGPSYSMGLQSNKFDNINKTLARTKNNSK